jgi:DNA polymerase-3 subunit beta
LLETIERVAKSASRDESRPVLTGILVRFAGGTLVMAATDSYRMSVKETSLEGAGPDFEAIIPARALQELTRIGAAADSIELGVHENGDHSLRADLEAVRDAVERWLHGLAGSR